MAFEPRVCYNGHTGRRNPDAPGATISRPMASPTTQLILVRHGETAWNGLGRIQGSLDSPLTRRGLAQARSVGARLARERIAALWASDLGRAQETAREVSAATALEIRTDAALRERFFGRLEGKTWDEIARDHPIDARLLKEDVHRPAPGGESLAQFRDRVTGALRRIAEAGGPGPVAVVTHGGVVGTSRRTAPSTTSGSASSARRPGARS